MTKFFNLLFIVNKNYINYKIISNKMEEKMKDVNEKVLKEIRSKLATLSTSTLLKYYEDLKSNIIPSNLSSYTQYLSTSELLENIEKELIVRGALKKIKKVDIY